MGLAPMPSSALLSALLAAVVFAGCFGSSRGGADDEVPSLVLPADFSIDGAQLVERNETFAHFTWSGTAPPGVHNSLAQQGSPPITLKAPIPPGLPIAFQATLLYDPPGTPLALEVHDEHGEQVCFRNTPGSSPDGRVRMACGAAVNADQPTAFEVRVISSEVPPPGWAFDVDIRYRIDPLANLLQAMAFDALNCRMHDPSTMDPLQVCLVPTHHLTWMPTLGMMPDGTVIAAPVTPPWGVLPHVDLHGILRLRGANATPEVIYAHQAGIETQQQSTSPYLHVDPRTGRIFFDNLPATEAGCGTIAMSDDAGATWTTVQALCSETGHQNVFTGPPRLSQPVGYPNIVYRCGINGGIYAGTQTTCHKSVNGGIAWTATGTPAFGPQTLGTRIPECGDKLTPSAPGHGHVDPEGMVLLPQGYCGQPMLALSDDEGLTWRVVQVSDLGMPLDTGLPFLGGGSTVGDFPLYDHEASVGVDAQGNIVYGWIANDRLPYVTFSSDAGMTWSEPLPIGPPDLLEATLGAMTVGASGAAFAYVGSTNSPGEPWTGDYTNTTWNAYLTVIEDVAGTPRLTTVTVNDPADPIQRFQCGPTRCAGIYDYIDAQIAPNGTPWAVFADACDHGCVLWRDTTRAEAELFLGTIPGLDLWDGGRGPYPG